METYQTEEKAQADTEEKAETEGEAQAQGDMNTEAAEVKDKAETQTEAAAEKKAEGEVKAESDANSETEEKVKTEAETKTEERAESKDETGPPDQNEGSAKGEVSETIQKMTDSPAELPGEPGKPATAEKATLNNIGVPSDVCARDIMQKELVWGNPEDSVQDALTKMQQHDSGYIMIGWDEGLEGIVSRSDIAGAMSIYLRPIFAKWHRPVDDATLQIKLKWIMSRPVRTIKPETPLPTIMENICRFGGRGLPVVDEQGKVQGLVTVFDIFRTLLNTNNDVSTVGKTAEAPAAE